MCSSDLGGQFWNGILQWDLHFTSFSVYEKRIIREIVRKIIWGEVFSEEELELGNSILDALPLMQISCDRIIQLGAPVKVIAPSSREDYLLLDRKSAV